MDSMRHSKSSLNLKSLQGLEGKNYLIVIETQKNVMNTTSSPTLSVMKIVKHTYIDKLTLSY